MSLTARRGARDLEALPNAQDPSDSKRKARRRTPWILCLVSPIWLVLLIYCYVSHMYGWAQVFFLWFPNWMVPFLHWGQPWEYETGVYDPTDPSNFNLMGYKAKRVRQGLDNADITLIYDFLSDSEVRHACPNPSCFSLMRVVIYLSFSLEVDEMLDLYNNKIPREYSGDTELNTGDDLQEKVRGTSTPSLTYCVSE